MKIYCYKYKIKDLNSLFTYFPNSENMVDFTTKFYKLKPTLNFTLKIYLKLTC